MKLIFKESKNEQGAATSFFFEPPIDFKWLAGQYLFYTLPSENPDNRGVTRYFTISSAPFEKNVSFTTKILDASSTFKKSLLKLKPGDEIEASGPDGEFTIENEGENFVFIAGGIGITPFRSILVQKAYENKNLNIHLLYANHDEDIVFKDELESLTNKLNLKIQYFISSARHASQLAGVADGPTRIDEKILVDLKSSMINPKWLISGPTQMVKGYRQLLLDIGVEKEEIKHDYFPGYSNLLPI